MERGFFEAEIGRTTEEFGNIVHVFTTYESRCKAEAPEPFQRGINSIQLLNDGTRDWIVSIFWDAERPDNPFADARRRSGNAAHLLHQHLQLAPVSAPGWLHHFRTTIVRSYH